MLANECFWLSKCAPNPTKRKRLGITLFCILKQQHWGLGKWSKVCPYCIPFLLQYYKLLQIKWLETTQAYYLTVSMGQEYRHRWPESWAQVLPGHIQGVSWAVVSAEAQIVTRIQFLVTGTEVPFSSWLSATGHSKILETPIVSCYMALHKPHLTLPIILTSGKGQFHLSYHLIESGPPQ